MEIKSTRFSKTYLLDRCQLIGEGNFAKVYRIFDEELKRYIAIRRVEKVEAELQDIAKEKKINEELQKVKSNNILEIFEIIQTKDHIWYLTEYCSGGSLWDALNEVKGHRLSEIETLGCILQISKGVQELHNHRITHRDLKPQNILLSRKYKKGQLLPDLKIADFGLSTKNIIMETVAGTKEYIAPEQARFQTYTNAVDVWSIGIIFDEILHGSPYYTGEDNKQVFQKIAKTEYKVRDQSITESIKTLLLSILKKKAYERPIIAVLRAKLEQILKELLDKQREEEEKAKSASNLIVKKAFSSQIRQPSASKDCIVREPSEIKFSNGFTRDTDSTAMDADVRQYKIPIYKHEKKRLYPAIKKNKKEDLSRLFVPMDQFLLKVAEERDKMRAEKLVMNSFSFNPNSKVASFEVTYNPFDRFTQLKKQFEYLNQILYEESYEIKILQTEHSLNKATAVLRKELKTARDQAREVFLRQIDQYIEEVVEREIA